MHWKEQLKTKIENLKDRDWKRKILVISAAGPVEDRIYEDQEFEFASVSVVVHLSTAMAARQAIGRINVNPWCGLNQGMIFLREFEIVNGLGTLNFGVRKDLPWNWELPTNWHYFDFDSLP